MTYAVLDDQSTDVFVTDSLLDELDVSGQEVNIQVNTIVGTNTLQMRKVSGLQIQDVNAEHSPLKVPYAYAQESIPATHHEIATPDITRQWEHLKVIVDKISYQPQIGIGMLMGRNIPTAFQLLKVIYGEEDKPWAEKYKFGWTIIRPICFDKIAPHEPTSEASLNHVMREELPVYNAGNVLASQISHPNRRTDIETRLQLSYSIGGNFNTHLQTFSMDGRFPFYYALGSFLMQNFPHFQPTLAGPVSDQAGPSGILSN